MSIRGAVLGLLMEQPMTGYEITKRFEHSLARIWPARSNQIYTELKKCESEDLVKLSEIAARNARRYTITDQGRSWVVQWLVERSPPEQQLRFEGLLKANFVALLAPIERQKFLIEEKLYWQEQSAWLMAQMKHLPTSSDTSVLARKHAAEAGLAVYEAMVNWADAMLKVEQVREHASK